MAAKKPATTPALPPSPLGSDHSPQAMCSDPTPAPARYLVGSTPILRDAMRFEPRSVIELSPAQAARLGLQSAPAESETPEE